MFKIPYFSARAAAKEAKREAERTRMMNSPVVQIGGFTVVNPGYRGPNPYRGPEMTDPRNAGKNFIFVRGGKVTTPQPQVTRHASVPESQSERRTQWAEHQRRGVMTSF